jgi:uncharacterized damage-inducible protein DinB
MRLKINRIFDRIEQDKSKMLQSLAQYSHKALNRKKTPESWTALQNIVHLMDAEKMALQYMQKKLQFQPNPPKTGLKHSFQYLLLRIMFGLPFLKFKAPSIFQKLPDEADLNAVATAWATERQQFKQFIDKLSDDVLDSELYKHPAVGKLNVLHMMEFTEVHCKRHYAQIRNILVS